MAVADYFRRNAMAASQLLCGLDNQGLLAILEDHRIGLVIDHTADSHEGRATADLVVRLLARFYPKLAIVAADTESEEHVEELAVLAKSINPKISLTRTTSSVTHCLVVGKSAITLKRKSARIIFIGSDNWLAKVSHKKPAGSGRSKNPFGAGVAACLAVAKVFRIVFAAQLDDISATDEEIELSVLALDAKDHSRGQGYRRPEIGKVYLVGAGAIGNGALWALSRAGAKGQLNIIDPQVIELSNLQRYVMTNRKDVDSGKAVNAEHWLSDIAGLSVKSYGQSWDDHVRTSDWMFPRVLVALDSADDRIGVQASLPQWIVNAWTRDSSIGISRHPTLENNGGSCLACLYLPDTKVPSEDELVASALGFSTVPLNNSNLELMNIRERLDRNIPCDQAFLNLIAAKKNVPIEALLPFENFPLRKLYTDGVCGGQVMGLLVDKRETRAEVPMAFQSALAGVLLAAELVIDALDVRGKPQCETTRINLLEPLKSRLSRPSGKDKDGRCICQDEDFKLRYSEKYTIVTTHNPT